MKLGHLGLKLVLVLLLLVVLLGVAEVLLIVLDGGFCVEAAWVRCY